MANSGKCLFVNAEKIESSPLEERTKATLRPLATNSADIISYSGPKSQAENDRKYLDAVRRGDMDTAQKMVREAAAKAMPDTKVVDEDGFPKVVYHNTSEKRKEFDIKFVRKGMEIAAHFFAPERDPYGEYGPVENAVFLNITNPAGFKEAYEGFQERQQESTQAGIEQREHLLAQGYDGGILTEDGKPYEYFVFDSNQIKSADPVTYDDAGNVIPLSQRFNPARADIRYSIGGLFTGSAADYDKPSLVKVGTGEGTQVYGWGLYASNVRGVAEGYAAADANRKENEIESKSQMYDRMDDFLYSLEEGGYWEYEPSVEVADQIRSGAIDVDDIIGSLKDSIELAEGPQRRREIREAIRFCKENKKQIDAEMSRNEKSLHLYEQTFFTDRAPGDESHLLKWYEPVSEEQLGWVRNAAEKEGVLDDRFKKFLDVAEKRINGEVGDKANGESLYLHAKWALGSPQAASEFLARAGIDGVKYPADSYGKPIKDGDEAGWNYVSFRDDNIRVDHKWVDGQQRFSVTITPEIRKDVTVNTDDMTREKADEILRTLAGQDLKNDETGIVAQINSVQRRKILSGVAVQKSIENGFTPNEHNAAASIIEKLWKHATLGRTDPDENGDKFVRSIKRFVAPVRFETKDAYAYLTVKESVSRGHRIYSIELEKLEALARKLGAQSPAVQSASDTDIISYSGSESQEGKSRFSIRDWVSQRGLARLQEGWTTSPQGLSDKELWVLEAVVPERHHTGSDRKANDVVLQNMYPPNFADWPIVQFVKQLNGNEEALKRVRDALFFIHGGHTNNRTMWERLNIPKPDMSNVPQVDRQAAKKRHIELLEEERKVYAQRRATQKRIGYPAYKDDAEWQRLNAEYERLHKERLSPTSEEQARNEAIKAANAKRDAEWNKVKGQKFDEYRDERIRRGEAILEAVARENGLESPYTIAARFSLATSAPADTTALKYFPACRLCSRSSMPLYTK